MKKLVETSATGVVNVLILKNMICYMCGETKVVVQNTGQSYFVSLCFECAKQAMDILLPHAELDETGQMKV